MINTDAERMMFGLMICQSIADNMTARQACRLHEISLSTFLGWCEMLPALNDQYVKARKILMEHWAEDIVEISDTPAEATITKVSTVNGTTVETRDAIEHRRLRVQSRQWLLSKLQPKKFGDKMQIGGAEDLPPIASTTNLSPEEAYKKMVGGKDGGT